MTDGGEVRSLLRHKPFHMSNSNTYAPQRNDTKVHPSQDHFRLPGQPIAGRAIGVVFSALCVAANENILILSNIQITIYSDFAFVHRLYNTKTC
jgi:hypothetical protein